MAQSPHHEVPDRAQPGHGRERGRGASSPAAAGADLALSRRLARLMDDLVTVPGTNVGVGADAMIGLIPGIGDVVGSTLSGVIVYDAVRLRVRVPVLARMGWNLLVDAVLGLVPGVGDLIDVAHRANRKNLALLERDLAEHPERKPPTLGYVLVAFALAVVPLAAGLVIGLLALWVVLRWLFG
jgi:Domain of unknown function (DUF4112)